MMTKARTAERLLQVVRVLDELPPEKRLDMDQWYKCGTVACALGWSAADPWFIKRDFKLGLYMGIKLPRYRNEIGGTAAALFFGISVESSRALFFPGGYKSRNPRRTTVAKKIRAFVKALLA